MSRNTFPIRERIALQPAEAGVALCAAVELPEGDAPEWIHLLPSGEIRTADDRGPYRVADPAALAKASLQAAGGPMVLEENHATDLAAPKGEPAPARGWITDLEARADGIWGKVEWTKAGLALMADRAYRHISPVITHLKDGRVTGILRASLINKPNLRGLAALHATYLASPLGLAALHASYQETNMEFLAKLRQALGLAEAADEAAIIAGIGVVQTAALQGALEPIAKAAGVKQGADAAAVLAGVEQLAGAAKSGDAVKALQAELATVTGELTTLKSDRAKEKATAFVDAAIRDGKVGVKPLRDHYIAMHAENPERVEKEIGAMPSLGPSGAFVDPPQKVSLHAQEPAALAADAAAYQKKLEATGQTIDFAAAVLAVKEGKQ
jgi:phage I-like protein